MRQLIRHDWMTNADWLFYIYNDLGCVDLAVSGNIKIGDDVYFTRRFRYDALMSLYPKQVVYTSEYICNMHTKESVRMHRPFTRDEFINKVTHRTVLDIEIVIDIDDKKHNVFEFDTVKHKSEHFMRLLANDNPVLYHTGSRGYHISVLKWKMRQMSYSQRKRFREAYLKSNWLYADLQLKSEIVTIALEGAVHYKSGAKKVKV